MARNTVSIPGEILKTTIIGGLTFDEIIILAAIPIVIVLPAIFIPFIPLWVVLILVGLGSVGVLIAVFKTPPGQSPVEWFPAYLDRRIKPDVYSTKPRDDTDYIRSNVAYKSVVYTANLIEKEASETPDKAMVDEMVETIPNAEKLERPEWSLEEDEDDGGILPI